jgi:protein gp37
MGQWTKIGWADHSWNTWIGCPKKTDECKNCYMHERLEDPGRVRVTGREVWDRPLQWQAEAEAAGRKDFVFTCSYSDFFNPEADDWRRPVWRIIRKCPNLIFLVLTKLPERIPDNLPPDWGEGYPNVWLGVSVGRNKYVGRADVLRTLPTVKRWLSCEPLLEPLPDLDLTDIDWVIVGGESGPKYRPMDLDWARDIRDRCLLAGVPFWFKQSAGLYPETGRVLDGHRWEGRLYRLGIPAWLCRRKSAMSDYPRPPTGRRCVWTAVSFDLLCERKQ